MTQSSDSEPLLNVVSTVALMTPQEIDQASKKSVSYRPPGG
jgi:hypothetical protein